jgi:hypothetical protein
LRKLSISCKTERLDVNFSRIKVMLKTLFNVLFFSFLRERLHCKEALVSSACGAEAGTFAFAVVKTATEKLSMRLGCKITRDQNYKGKQ